MVTFAQQAPTHNSGSASYPGRSKRSDATPTALSLMKSGGVARPEACVHSGASLFLSRQLTSRSSKTSSKIAMMEAKLRQMASSSPFAERPALPSRPAGSQVIAPGSTHAQSASSHGSRSISGKAERTRDDSGQRRSTALPLIRDAESSDMTRFPPSNKNRNIPGVKIVKGSSDKGTPSGLTPST